MGRTKQEELKQATDKAFRKLDEQLNLHGSDKKVRCTACSWEGTENDLIECIDDDTGETIDGCPNCLDDKDLLDL